MNPEKEGSTHKDFTQEMAKKTVINRACKRYLNSSDDGSLLMHHVNRADEIFEEAEIEAEIEENANKELIDIELDTIDDVVDETTESKVEENLIDGPGF